MNCHWCNREGPLEGPASRCQSCGGAHWLCQLCGTRLVPESKHFCSYCGTARSPAQRLNPDSAPQISVIRHAPSVRCADQFEAEKGFCIRAVEGNWVDGRILFAGATDLLVSPGFTEKGAGKFQIIQRLGSPEQLAEGLNVPRVLDGGIAIIGSTTGLYAVSTHTGGMERVLDEQASVAVPLVVRRNASAMHVFAAVDVPGGREGKLVHLIYHPSGCLECGCFECVGETPLPRNLAAMVDVPGSEGGEPEIWFLFDDRQKRTLVWRAMKAPYQKLEGENPVMKSLPGVLVQRLTLHVLPQATSYVVGRSGNSAEDGARAVSKTVDKNASPEIERPAGTLLPQPPFELCEIGGLGAHLARSRALDGSWVRVGAQDGGMRWSWCGVGDDSVSFVAEPNQGAWDSDMIENMLGFRPGPNDVGPVVPTPWGLATCAVSGDMFNLIYMDFQTAS